MDNGTIGPDNYHHVLSLIIIDETSFQIFYSKPVMKYIISRVGMVSDLLLKVIFGCFCSLAYKLSLRQVVAWIFCVSWKVVFLPLIHNVLLVVHPLIWKKFGREILRGSIH